VYARQGNLSTEKPRLVVELAVQLHPDRSYLREPSEVPGDQMDGRFNGLRTSSKRSARLRRAGNPFQMTRISAPWPASQGCPEKLLSATLNLTTLPLLPKHKIGRTGYYVYVSRNDAYCLHSGECVPCNNGGRLCSPSREHNARLEVSLCRSINESACIRGHVSTAWVTSPV
jgi:hypothetical protein